MRQRLFVRLDEDPIQGPESSVPAATLKAFAVSASLQPHISQVLHYREAFSPEDGVVERVLPDGAVRLIVHLDAIAAPAAQSRRDALVAVGPSAECALVPLRDAMDSLSITIRPASTQALLGLPAGEIAGKAVSLADLWGREGGDLRARLAAQPDVPARVTVLQTELARRLTHSTSPADRTATRALDTVVAGRGRLSVRDVAATMGVGERRLQQLFQTHIGLSPSAWRRLARLHACLRMLRRQPRGAWADVAVDAGFYDQSHLINEVRELCGCTPTELRGQAISGSSNTVA